VAWLLFLGGLAGLLIGAEGLIKGACRIAVSFGISRIVVGLTVVAPATSQLATWWAATSPTSF
jgi:cation:H+ antiporter